MNLANQPAHTITKAQQTFKRRIKPTQRQMGEISTKVRQKVNARTFFAPVGCCERCGRNRNGYWTLEQAHITSRNHIKHKTTERDLLRLCGPSTKSGTCHHWVESTRAGREWMKLMQSRMS